MSIDSRQKRESSVGIGCPWRGQLVDATQSGTNAGNRAAAAYFYSGFGSPAPPSAGAQVHRSPLRNLGGMFQ